jgi:glutamate formiminotransferase
VLECIPNVSDGRRPQVIGALADELVATAGVRLLDRSSDPSHNRSVFTCVGDAAGLEQAMVSLCQRAASLIDLRGHHGVHPRIGAVDVIPFVPLSGSVMADAVVLARRVGARIAAECGVPVYLYEEAALQPDRRQLEAIRRGGFEGLAGKMATREWAPDFGPLAPHPTAGATAVGARRPLIAFNVNLATDRVDLARQIARTVRASSGGLPALKAMGVALLERGVVQVSMNLTDYTRTSMIDAFEAVRREAERLGVSVIESELIGLAPAAALDAATAAAIGLVDYSPRRILEQAIATESADPPAA